MLAELHKEGLYKYYQEDNQSDTIILTAEDGRTVTVDKFDLENVPYGEIERSVKDEFETKRRNRARKRV